MAYWEDGDNFSGEHAGSSYLDDFVDENSSNALLPSNSKDNERETRSSSRRKNRISEDAHGWRQRYKTPLVVGLVLVACVLSFFLGHASPRFNTTSLDRTPSEQSGPHIPEKPIKTETADSKIDLSKPLGLKVVAVIFFGRKKYVDILDCYLRRNLAVNGGILDEVHFIADNVRKEDDRTWLKDMVKRSNLSDQYLIKITDESKRMHWTKMWKNYVTERKTIYVKIDDDIVFIEDSAIPRLVHTLIANPKAHNVQSNVINCRQNEWFHWHLGAVLPFLPEMERSWRSNEENETNLEGNVWRHSTLPMWSGDKKTRESFNWHNHEWKPPFSGHRWLPLEPTALNLEKTPIWTASNPDGNGHTFSHWGIAAQEHYSLLYHLENNSLDAYHWGKEDGTWNPWYQHYDINMMAIRGKTLRKTAFWGWGISFGDQWALTEAAPKRMRMPYLINTRAIVAHFSFNPVQGKLLRTDLLSRYRAYANENACAADNQKVSFD